MMNLISASLVKAQKAFGPALKTNTNPAFRSKYADLSACIEAVVDALNENGVMLMQRTLECDSGVTVETVFLHESGEQMSSGPLHVPAPKQDPQGYGSALTYARRYSLMAACGIAPEDDDGNAASKQHESASKQRDSSAKAPTPKGMPESAIADYIAAMESSDRDSLEGLYKKAKESAKKADDIDAANQFAEVAKRVLARLTQPA